jgi:uncharacterized membrane protein
VPAASPRPESADGQLPPHRRTFLDWLRGVAVLVMVEAHLLDSWTAPADRTTFAFGRAMTIGGFGAPLFLFLAGVAAVLSADARSPRLGRADAAAAVRRRGWQVFGLAFLFRLQSFVLSPGSPPIALLKVDILNIMGPGIVMAGALWQWARTRAGQLGIFALATLVIAMATPITRATPFFSPLPDPIEAYIRPSPGRTTFVLFPWVGFVFAGAAAGVVLSASSSGSRERRTNLMLAGAGISIAYAGYAASFRPSIYASSSFWTSSPTFFFVRVGILLVAVAAAYLWDQRPTRRRWSPLQQLGRSSLFIYWIHVEMVYGLMSWPLHGRLPIGWALAAYVIFVLVLLALSMWKDRVVRPGQSVRKALTGSIRVARLAGR